MKRSLLSFFYLILIICFAPMNAKAQKSEYKLAKTIQLTNDGGWEYLAVDEVNQKLFVSHSSLCQDRR